MDLDTSVKISNALRDFMLELPANEAIDILSESVPDDDALYILSDMLSTPKDKILEAIKNGTFNELAEI